MFHHEILFWFPGNRLSLCQRNLVSLSIKPVPAVMQKARGITTSNALPVLNAPNLTRVKLVVDGLRPPGNWQSRLATPFPPARRRRTPFIVFLLLPPYQGGGVWLLLKETPVT